MTSDWKILGPLMAGMVALFGWVAKHISNSQKHPCKDDVVFRDVCESERKRLDDCIEGEIKRSEERYQELKADMLRGFGEIKDLIKGG